MFLWFVNDDIIQLLPLSEGDMTICSPEAGNIARGRSPRAILPVEGEQIVMSPSLNGNNCFIIPNHIWNNSLREKQYYPHTRTTLLKVSIY